MDLIFFNMLTGAESSSVEMTSKPLTSNFLVCSFQHDIHYEP
jgi:hypothetical protein